MTEIIPRRLFFYRKFAFLVRLSFALSIIFFLISTSYSQQENSQKFKRVAFVNEVSFEDEKDGIAELVKAWISVENGDVFPPQNEEVQEIQNQLKNQNLTSEERKQKEERLKILGTERKAIYERAYANRKNILLSPVLAEIADFLKKVESQNNVVILQAAKIDEEGKFLAVNKKFEVSSQFAVLFNNRKENSSQLLKLEIPEGKIAIVDTKQFGDVKEDAETYKFIQAFADEKDFAFIFDANKELPVELRNFPVEDVTKEFISYYNQKNP